MDAIWECNQVRPTGEFKSDIENVWTLLVFFVPSCIAIAALLVHYAFLHKPLDQLTWWDVNPVDVVVLQWFRDTLGRLGVSFGYLDRRDKDDGFRAAFDQFMLTLADVHVGFGLAILAYGFSSLLQGFTAYDWWLMVGLAWFAVTTNLVMLIGLRDFLQYHPGKRAWRLCLIVGLIAVLAFCMVPISGVRRAMTAYGHGSKHDILATNILCFFPGREEGPLVEELGQATLGWSTIAGCLGLVVALAVVTITLERRNGILRTWIEHYRGEMRESFSSDQNLCIRCEQRFILLVMRPCVALWLIIRAYLDILNSVLAQLSCAVALLAWVTLRFLDLLQLQHFGKSETSIELAHFIAFIMLLAPLKSLVEYIYTACRKFQGFRFRIRWPSWRNSSRGQYQPCESVADESDYGETGASEEADKLLSGSSRTSSRRRTGLKLPMRFKFYLETEWYVKAVPVAGVSCLAQLILMFILATVGGELPIVAVSHLAPWFVAFAPSQVVLFILAAMVIEEKGRSTESKRVAYWVSSVIFGAASVASAVDSIYGLGGFPMSYIGMATLALMIVTYVLYGCISKPGSLAKGKGVSDGGMDEESALLGSKVQVKIPVRRSKRYQAHTRRLSKQSIKDYGTMVKPSN
ncbi:hypothetical protein BKA67DRAFT_661578 [Truncatella angustata]|uniref:Transmembrane protein n=1 Tax=Truncatella angustata TaxID=152316 RepID=A0A9P8UER9_9PEZI|nr:uncharacterized protein BKA67DRAFT_661578 [Truncatella angustata]KAH6648616.1 hypothetical protein BKA67DRAFT_661578 [Truncatella angustata]